ncbi:MAG: hypothetical protein AAF531_00965 [Actinomycetota bacterium]
MADESGEDLSKLMEELELDGVDGALGDASEESVVGAESAGPGGRERVIGLIALLLGIIGSLITIVFAAVVIRFGFTASDTVDRAMEPIEVSFDRLEDRIDQTDDLVDRDGIVPDRIDELQARVDGLVDVSTAAHQGFEAVQDHPVYSLLPAEFSSLGERLGAFEESSLEIDRLLDDAENGDTITAAAATGVADQLDSMQGRVSEVREAITSAASSLRRWIRLGSFLGFLGALWGLWGQVSLAKRGWRGFRGR